jgi:diadenosine tetraphosphate (Ap4A) HIT family hydrolase
LSDAACPFCAPAAERIFHAGPFTLGLWDAFRASEGHALLVPKRYVAEWNDDARPFVWTKSAREVKRKIRRVSEISETGQ